MADLNLHAHHWAYDRNEEGEMRRKCYSPKCGVVEVRIEKGVWYNEKLGAQIIRARRYTPTPAEAAAIKATARGHRQGAIAAALAADGFVSIEYRGGGYMLAGRQVFDTYYGGTKIDSKSMAALRGRLRDVGFLAWRHRTQDGRLEFRVVFKERVMTNE